MNSECHTLISVFLKVQGSKLDRGLEMRPEVTMEFLSFHT